MLHFDGMILKLTRLVTNYNKKGRVDYVKDKKVVVMKYFRYVSVSIDVMRVIFIQGSNFHLVPFLCVTHMLKSSCEWTSLVRGMCDINDILLNKPRC